MVKILSLIFALTTVSAYASKTGLKLKSTAFKKDQIMDNKYVAAGDNLSPTLSWKSAPSGTKEFVLIVDDPDAAPFHHGEPFTHWIAYGIAGDIRSLPQGIPAQKTVDRPVYLSQGMNSAGKIGYTGPFPPPGSGIHHYHFTLYALDKAMGLAPALNKEDVLAAIRGHVLEQADLVGIYEIK